MNFRLLTVFTCINQCFCSVCEQTQVAEPLTVKREPTGRTVAFASPEFALQTEFPAHYFVSEMSLSASPAVCVCVCSAPVSE